jgi:hypothetical protein
MEATMFHRVLTTSLWLASLVGAAVVFAVPAQADTRYISTTGKNTNPCTLAQPCKTLQRGVAMTPAGGELRILDTGFYGNNTNIKKSITITGNGNTVYLGNTLTIDKANAVVALRGLVLDGQGGVAIGINIVAAGTVHIERCLVHNFTDDGIRVTTNAANVRITDTTSRDNGGDGLDKFGSSAVIENSHFDNNALNGVRNQSGSATIRGSTASGNGNDGVFASGSLTAVSTIAARNGNNGFTVPSQDGPAILEFSVADNNGGAGLQVGGDGSAIISNSTFTRNATGIANTGGVGTRENNTVSQNTANLTGNAPIAIGSI